MNRVVAVKKKPRLESQGVKILKSVSHGGAREARTPDLLNAIQTLYQLSYDPVRKRSANVIFLRHKSKHFRLRHKIFRRRHGILHFEVVRLDFNFPA